MHYDQSTKGTLEKGTRSIKPIIETNIKQREDY